MRPRRVEVDVGGRRHRALEPRQGPLSREAGFTKGRRHRLLRADRARPPPAPADRPLTLKRYPNGVDGPFFYEKRCPRTGRLAQHRRRSGARANQEVIHLLRGGRPRPAGLGGHHRRPRAPHPPARARDSRRPPPLVFDLDPGPPADVVTCCDVALLLRRLLDRLGLASFPKTSGSKGLQIYVPLNGRAGLRGDEGLRPRRGPAPRARPPEPLVVERMLKACAPGRCSSTGARTTATRPPSAPTPCGRAPARPCRRRSAGARSSASPGPGGVTPSSSRPGTSSPGWRAGGTSSRPS